MKVWSISYALHFRHAKINAKYMNIVYVGKCLVYLVLAYEEWLILTICFFLAISELLAISYLIAFSIVIYEKFNSSYPPFFHPFHVVSKLYKSDL